MGFSNLPRKEVHFFSLSVGWERKAKHDPTGRLIWHITILLFIPPLSWTWGGGKKGGKDHKTEHDEKRFQPHSQVSFAKASRRIASYSNLLSHASFSTQAFGARYTCSGGEEEVEIPTQSTHR
jgi:hypothetical protein